jgi:hypothetical protein
VNHLHPADAGERLHETGDIIDRRHPRKKATSPILADPRQCVATGGFGGPSPSVLSSAAQEHHRNQSRLADRRTHKASAPIFGPHVFDRTPDPALDACAATKGKSCGRSCRRSTTGFEVLYNLLYVTNQDGTTVVFQPNAERYEEVSRNGSADATPRRRFPTATSSCGRFSSCTASGNRGEIK